MLSSGEAIERLHKRLIRVDLLLLSGGLGCDSAKYNTLYVIFVGGAAYLQL